MRVQGNGGLEKVVLRAPDGAQADVYLHGAHVTSWIPADGRERLFLSAASEFAPGAAIRGGIPVVFPQFSNRGTLPKHGFARTSVWELATLEEDLGGRAAAMFRLDPSDETLALWPHPFVLELYISVGGQSLEATLTVSNSGDAPFTFAAALHTYLVVHDLEQVRVRGLEGLTYVDTASGGTQGRQAEEELTIRGEVDRIYLNAPDHLELAEPGATILIQKNLFPDAVVWNPGPQRGATLADLEPDGYRRFVCVEPALIGTPVELQPGNSWAGRQNLTVLG